VQTVEPAETAGLKACTTNGYDLTRQA